MNLYQKIFEKYDIGKLDTKCTELLEICIKLEFYKKRTFWYLVPLYVILCAVTEFVIKCEVKHVKNLK